MVCHFERSREVSGKNSFPIASNSGRLCFRLAYLEVPDKKAFQNIKKSRLKRQLSTKLAGKINVLP